MLRAGRLRTILHLEWGHRLKAELKTLGAVVLGSVLMFHVLHTWVIGTVFIQGNSMNPTLHSGDRYLVHRWAYLVGEPRRGDIVVLRDPHDYEPTIKRVVGLPGDWIQFREGEVIINDQRVIEPYLWRKTVTLADQLGEKVYEVADQHYFLMGDNRHQSRDSRHIGAVHRKLVLGKIFHPTSQWLE